MATQTESSVAKRTSAKGNPSKTLAVTVPGSTKPHQADDSTTTAPSTTDVPGNAGEEPEDTKGSAFGSLSGTSPAVTDTEKKIRRAERFGINVQLSEKEKRNSRAERFGTASASPSHESDFSMKEEEHKRKARAERFGLPVLSVSADEETKKKARLERFGSAHKIDAVEEDKRKARALRFSQPSTGSLPVNGKGNIEPKAAIASKAGVSS